MELLIVRGGEWDLLYNCSFYEVSQVPFERRQKLVEGILFLTMGVVQELLYFVCMFAIWNHFTQSSCYKIMFYMGVLDMACLTICGISAGIFGILGVVYCSCPTLNYLLGAISFGLWYAETLVEAVLAFNRCLELCSKKWSKILFSDNKVWFWMVPPTLYGIYLTVFWKSATFSAEYFSWFYNPHVGYVDSMAPLYTNIMHSIHNWSVTIGISAIYLFFGLTLYWKSKSLTPNSTTNISGESMNSHRRIFVQVALISAVNGLAASIYCYMDFSLNDVLIVVANVAWVQAHGIPPVIYLVINRTLRDDTIAVLRSWGEALGVLKKKPAPPLRGQYHQNPGRPRTAWPKPLRNPVPAHEPTLTGHSTLSPMHFKAYFDNGATFTTKQKQQKCYTKMAVVISQRLPSLIQNPAASEAEQKHNRFLALVNGSNKFSTNAEEEHFRGAESTAVAVTRF